MRIDILTLFPEMFSGAFDQSIIKRAKEKGIAEIFLHDIREYAKVKSQKLKVKKSEINPEHIEAGIQKSKPKRQVDDYPYGGGSGMVMMIEPIANCIDKLKAERTYDEIIFMTPDGELLEQKTANHLSTMNNLMLLCGHYKGIDERVREMFITKEISIGNYVLSGGELAAAVVSDSIIRLIPGVLNDETSALSDSFQDGLLSPPVYTRPSEFRGIKVPDVLLSGNDKEIYKWKMEKAIEKTRKHRPGMMEDDMLI